MALRLLLGADIAAADLVDRRGHGHVLIHHLDAGLGRFLGERHDRRLAGMAHHRDAVGLGGDRLAQLLHHLLVDPAGEDVIDLRAGVGRRLPGAVIDDRAEGVALGAADEEADMHLAAPFVAQRRRLRGALTPTIAATPERARPKRATPVLNEISSLDFLLTCSKSFGFRRSMTRRLIRRGF